MLARAGGGGGVPQLGENLRARAPATRRPAHAASMHARARKDMVHSQTIYTYTNIFLVSSVTREIAFCMLYAGPRYLSK